MLKGILWEQIGVISGAILGAAGVIVLLRKFYLFLKKQLKDYKVRANDSFQGNWSNGGVEKYVPTHYVDVKIYGSNNEIRGSVNVRPWTDDNSWTNAFLFGKRTFKRIKCHIIANNDPEGIILGTVVFKRKKKKLQWVLSHQEELLFPTAELLHKDLPIIA